MFRPMRPSAFFRGFMKKITLNFPAEHITNTYYSLTQVPGYDSQNENNLPSGISKGFGLQFYVGSRVRHET